MSKSFIDVAATVIGNIYFDNLGGSPSRLPCPMKDWMMCRQYRSKFITKRASAAHSESTATQDVC